MSKILQAGQDYVEGHIVETLHKLDDKLELVSNDNAKGAASSTHNAIALFDGGTGKMLRNSNVTIIDSGNALDEDLLPSIRLDYRQTPLAGDKLAFFGRGEFSLPNTNTVYLGSIAQGVVAAPSYNFGILLSSTTRSRYELAMFDAANARVGILTTAPSDTFDINGTLRIRNNTKFNGQIIDNNDSAGTGGQVLKKVGGIVKWSNTLSSCSVFNTPTVGTQIGLLSLNVKKHDIANEFNTTTNRLTVTVAGLYLLNFSALKLAGTETKIYFRKNGSQIGSGASRGITTNNEIMDSTEIVQLSVGDYIDVYINAGQVVTDYQTNKFLATLLS